MQDNRQNCGRRWYDLTRSSCIVLAGASAASGAFVGWLVTYIWMR